MSKSLTKKDVFWGYTSQIFNISAPILLLPFVLRYMISEEVGIWFVFISLIGLAQLFEFGFLQTYTRNISYAYSGVEDIEEEGLIENNSLANKIPNEVLIKKIYFSSKRIYRRISFFIFIFMLTASSIFLFNLKLYKLEFLDLFIPWIIISLSVTFSTYYGYINSFLQGRGDLILASQSILINRLIFLVLSIFSLWLNYGLYGLALSYLVSAIFFRLLGLNFLKRCSIINESLSEKNIIYDNLVQKKLWFNSKRQGIVQISAFIIQRSSTLFASFYLGPGLSASFSLTASLLISLMGVAVYISQVNIPYLCFLNVNNEKELAKKEFGKILISGWLIYLIGFIFIYIFCNDLLTLIDSKTLLIRKDFLLYFGIIIFLETNHSISASFITSLNIIPFHISAILSGTLHLVISLLFISEFGILGLIMAQGIVQLIYNNWKWPYDVSNYFNCNYFYLLFLGFKSYLNFNKVVKAK